jgi:hypothetical protein
MDKRAWNLDGLKDDQCKVGFPGVPSGYPLEKRVCCQEVVNIEYQLCEKHDKERNRLLALFGDSH